MKKLGRILCLAALVVTMTASICFGTESLKIVEAYPEDGQKNTTIENMCVKLWFNHEMGDKETVKANEKCFKLTDSEGKEVPTRVFYHPEDTKQVLVLADTTKKLNIKDNTEYTLTVSKDLMDNDGHTLAQEAKYSFTTLNASQNNMVYMVMMFAMFGAMFFFTHRQMKKQQEEQNGGNKPVKEEAFNPYKEAKKTGKSVAEVIAAHEKEMAKKAAKEARKAARHNDDEDEYEEIEENGNYRVKGPRPISASGSTYITGRKAEAEAKAAEEERLAKRRAANAKKKKKK